MSSRRLGNDVIGSRARVALEVVLVVAIGAMVFAFVTRDGGDPDGAAVAPLDSRDQVEARPPAVTTTAAVAAAETSAAPASPGSTPVDSSISVGVAPVKPTAPDESASSEATSDAVSTEPPPTTTTTARRATTSATVTIAAVTTTSVQPLTTTSAVDSSFSLPSFVGLTAQQAIAAVGAAGLTTPLQCSHLVTCDVIVTAQGPVAGTPVQPGELIYLYFF